MTSKKAQTTKARQTSYKARKAHDGYVQLTAWVKRETLSKITDIAASKGIDRGEVIEELLKD